VATNSPRRESRRLADVAAADPSSDPVEANGTDPNGEPAHDLLWADDTGSEEATTGVTRRSLLPRNVAVATTESTALTPEAPVDADGRARLEARKVRRLIRHVDPWSVLKAALLFFLSLWFVVMIAAIIVWAVARGSGTIDKLETFVQTNLGVPDWHLDGNFLFRQFGLLGLIGVLATTLAATIGSVVFNLISDIIGGVWVTVIEEETARRID
jgi:hypothetical protein